MTTQADSSAQPWKARPDWAAGRITGQNRKTMLIALIFGGLWNALVWPIVIVIGPDLVTRRDPRGLILAIFPLVGAGLALWAFRATARYLRHGQAVFQMTTIPGVIGGPLRGTILTKLAMDDVSHLTLKLVCVRRVVTGSGKNRSTRESILWQDERTLDRHVIGSGGGSAMIPVEFRVPADAPESDNRQSDDAIIWRLHLFAARTGIDYSTLFEVPVFRTESSRMATSISDPPADTAHDLSTYAQPSGSRVSVAREGGTTLIHLPAARNIKAILTLGVFTGIWSAFFAFLMIVEAPLFFRVVWGFFDALLTLCIANMLLVSRSIRVTPGEIGLTTSFALIPFVRTVQKSDLDRVEMIIGMQSDTRAWYQIRLILKSGSSRLAATGLPDKQEARWLASLIGGERPVQERIVKTGHDRAQAMRGGSDGT